MLLNVPLPPEWTIEDRGGVRAVRIPGTTVVLAIGDLVARPDDLVAWARAQLGENADIVMTSDELTDDGWPLQFVVSRASDRMQVHVFYSVLVYVATIAITGDASELDAHRAMLRALAIKAKPELGRGPLAIGELFD